MTGAIWRTALWTLLAGLGCQGHRSAAAAPAPPAGMRTLQLARPGADTSCLEPGGTRVSANLSDADVSEVEVLIRRLDQRPIIEVTRLSPERVRETGGAELEARTGAACGGPLSGGGSEFYFQPPRRRLVDHGSRRLAGGYRRATDAGAVSRRSRRRSRRRRSSRTASVGAEARARSRWWRAMSTCPARRCRSPSTASQR